MQITRITQIRKLLIIDFQQYESYIICAICVICVPSFILTYLLFSFGYNHKENNCIFIW